LPGWKTLFRSFNEEYPDVNLTAEPAQAANWAEFFDKISTQLAGGKTFDIVYVPTEGQLLFTSRDLIEPLDAYIERDKAEIDDFYDDVNPKLIEMVKAHSPSDDKTYFIPYIFNTMCIWWNTDLFQRAGVDAPADNWTWDDFLASAERITKQTDAFGMVAAPELFAGIMPWLLTNGASALNAEWTKATISTPAAVEAAEFMRSMVEQDISPAPGGEFDPFSAAAQDKLAMFGGGRWPVLNMRALGTVNKMKITLWPQEEGKGSPVGWGSLPILRNSQNKEAAWAFVKYLTTKKGQKQVARAEASAVPARESVARSDAFLANSPEGSIKLYEALEYSTPVPGPEKGNIVQQDIEDTFTRILVGDVATDQGLEELDANIQESLEG